LDVALFSQALLLLLFFANAVPGTPLAVISDTTTTMAKTIMFLKSLIAKELCLVIFHCYRRILDFKRFPVIISDNTIILLNSAKDLLAKVYYKYNFFHENIR
jgi:hypothetical protein